MRKKAPTVLLEGKLPIAVLTPLLASIPMRGNLVVAPNVGVDVGVIRSRGKYIVSSSDPITGADKRLGWHAVNVSANDVATSGIMPTSLNAVLLLPPSTHPEKVRRLLFEINACARGLGISVAGGHTEITPDLPRPILVVTAYGSGDEFVTSSMAKRDDAILMTKTAGIEGTSIISRLPGVQKLLSKKVLADGRGLISGMSIVKEARTAFKTGHVHAMHDVTEGGVLGAVAEMSLASGLGFYLDADSVPIDPSTRQICSALGIDPLKLLGSGSLLISCREADALAVMRPLNRQGIICTKIGRMVSKSAGRKVVSGDRARELIDISIQDEVWPALKKFR
ncbi:MAG TPA: AIR synthase-related protein [Nitrososphaerales archaeon]|nr:AIR synthase-related protein [Nitrososphaerales archaeon]